MEDRIENLLEAGVLDPAKVTRSGLQNACGIAGIMLTTQARLAQVIACVAQVVSSVGMMGKMLYRHLVYFRGLQQHAACPGMSMSPGVQTGSKLH